MTLLAAAACGPRSATSPNHPNAEARNGETEKKSRKPRPLVAPPPAYGNKIVIDQMLDDDGAEDTASNSSGPGLM